MKKAVVLALALVMVLGVAGAAFADVSSEYVGSGSPLSVSNSTAVTVSATVNPRLTLTITTPDAGQTVDFGAVNPGVNSTDSVSLQVKSNKLWTASTSTAGSVAAIGLTTTNLSGLPGYGTRGVTTLTDTYTVNPPYTTDPDLSPYTATVTYTVTQTP